MIGVDKVLFFKLLNKILCERYFMDVIDVLSDIFLDELEFIKIKLKEDDDIKFFYSVIFGL